MSVVASDPSAPLTEIDGASVGIRAVRPEDDLGLEALLGGMNVGSRWLRIDQRRASTSAASTGALKFVLEGAGRTSVSPTSAGADVTAAAG